LVVLHRYYIGAQADYTIVLIGGQTDLHCRYQSHRGRKHDMRNLEPVAGSHLVFGVDIWAFLIIMEV
jgi:hypothetical protein